MSAVICEGGFLNWVYWSVWLGELRWWCMRPIERVYTVAGEN